MSDQVFLSSQNAVEIVSCKIDPIPLPNHPQITARVRQIPIGKLERLSRVAGGKGDEAEKARFELIKDSIVNEDGSPVFATEESIKALKEANAPIFSDLVVVIGKANNKSKAQINEEVDDIEKN
jgi:hypothetical protein